MTSVPLLEDAMATVLGAGDPRPRLLSLVETLAEAPADVPASRHVLGFLHCRLGACDDRTVALHVWPDGPRQQGEPVWPVHSHRWTISSAVIAGYLVNETFRVRPSETNSHQLYEVRYISDELSERQRTGQHVEISPHSADRWNAGDRYEIPLGTYHTTNVPHDVFAATVMVTGKKEDVPPLVVGDASGVPSYRYGVDPVDTGEWAAVLDRLREMMTRATQSRESP